MTWTVPTPEEQVLFLRNMQRLLAEGLFVASYKFALVHALADLAVLQGDDTGAPLDIDTKEIAAKFVELYWRQSRPLQGGAQSTGFILQQNTGKQAAIISQVATSQQECGGSLFRFQQSAADRWSSLIGEVDHVVRTMPLWKLQTVGDERLEFLYENLDRGSRITLKPGVAYCFRAFYELVRDLVQGAWVRFVQKLNDRCNHAKSNSLAAENHLAAWVERNHVHRDELHERLVGAALPSDSAASARIAQWVYQQTEKSNGQVWVEQRILRRLGPEWSKCFRA